MRTIDWGRWYVARTKQHQEAWAQEQITRRGVATFFPRLRLPQVRPRQRPLVPLFPGYLFVHLTTPGAYDAVRWAPGVSQVVSFAGQPAPLDDAVIPFLRRRVGPDGILVAQSPFAAGQGVEIVAGPLAGLAGVIAQPPDARGRVRLLLHLLQRHVRAEVPVHLLTCQP